MNLTLTPMPAASFFRLMIHDGCRRFFITHALFLLFAPVLAQYRTSYDSLRLILPTGHGSIINDVIETPDLKYVITCSDDNTVKIWEQASGKLVNTLAKHVKRVNGLQYDRVSSLLLTFSEDNYVYLWQLNSSDPVQSFNAGSDINMAAINSLTREVIAVTDDNYILVWNLITGELKRKINAHESGISRMQLSCGGKRMVSFGRDGFLKVWDTRNWKCILTDRHGCDMPVVVKSVEHSDTIYYTKNDSLVIEYNVATNQILRTVTVRTPTIFDFDVSANGRFWVISCHKDQLWVFDKNLADITAYRIKIPDWGYQVAIHPNNDRFSVGVKNGDCIEYDLIHRKELFRRPMDDRGVEQVLYTKGGQHVFFGGRTGKCRLVETLTGRIRFDLNARTNPIVSIQVLDSLRSLVVGTSDRRIRAFDLVNWTYDPLHFPADLPEANRASFNDAEQQLLIYGLDSITAFDCVRKKVQYQLDHKTGDIYRAAFNQSGDKFYLISNDKKIRIYHSATGSLLDSFMINLGYDYISAASFSSNDSLLFLGGSEGTVYVYNVYTRKKIAENALADEFINSIYHDSEKSMVYVLSDHALFYWDLNTNLVKTERSDEFIMGSQQIGRLDTFLVGMSSGKIERFTRAGGRSSTAYRTTSPISALSSPIAKQVIGLGLLNGSVEFWDITTQTQIGTLVLLDNSNYLLKLARSPYYMCSREASKLLHYVTPSLQVIGFDQLDPVFNRPDLVLDSLGLFFGKADQQRIQHYRALWRKRLTRLGLDTVRIATREFSIPSVEWINSNTIGQQSDTSILELKIRTADPIAALVRFNVLVNEVPVFGAAGIPIQSAGVHVWDTTLAIQLGQGENKIQLLAMNELGLESFKYPFYVEHRRASSQPPSKTVFIGVGVDRYIQNEHNLAFCVKDVTDLASGIQTPLTHVQIFKNEEVTRESVLGLKRYLVDSTTVDDRVIISCSAHGLLDDSLNFYLAMHDMDFTNPRRRGLAFEDLESLLDSIPARKKLLLLDACNSGENDIESLSATGQSSAKSEAADSISTATRGLQIERAAQSVDQFQSMQEIFINIRNRTGSMVISAAGGKQSALEGFEVYGRKIENGAFTYSVLEFLRSNRSAHSPIGVNRLNQYVEKRVYEITRGRQRPTSRQEILEMDWELE